jgi:predicted dehydrogenase
MSTDYTIAPLMFRVQKVMRYIRLYGLRRTWHKVRGQYHMKARDGFEGTRWVNPDCRDGRAPARKVGLIGCGNFAFTTLAYFLTKARRNALQACQDVAPERARSLAKTYGACYATRNWQDVVEDPQIELVYIASNHASHGPYAAACIRAGKHVHIEKPHVVSRDQHTELLEAMSARPDVRVFLGFNRPRSRLFRLLQARLAEEKGPMMINWFIAGHEIAPDHWYFDPNEGGRVLGNLCHWTDLTLHLVGRAQAFPCRIVPACPPDSLSDFVVTLIFADGSCAAITFSAKGHTFEGVREVLRVHRGNTLATLDDFKELRCDILERTERITLLHRDHGHEANVLHSLTSSRGEDIQYIAATGGLFLAVKEAIETGCELTLTYESIIGGLTHKLHV